jgi:hypothetical protein
MATDPQPIKKWLQLSVASMQKIGPVRASVSTACAGCDLIAIAPCFASATGGGYDIAARQGGKTGGD